MPYDMQKMLENDTHLKPLLHYYLGEFDPKLAEKEKLKEKDWECIQSPDGAVTGIRLDVVAGSVAGSINIRDGYLRALAHCLQQGLTPPAIRIVSIINHHQAHWTSAVADFQVNNDFYESLQVIFVDQNLQEMSIQTIVNTINASLHPVQTTKEIDYDMSLFGTDKVSIKHYDSHNANPKKHIGPYYTAYRETLNPLVDANPDIDLSIEAAECKQQKGNTCGDNALWNGFMAGVLGLSPEEEFCQMDSKALRAFSEYQLKDLKELEKDRPLASQVKTRVQENIVLARQLAQEFMANKTKSNSESQVEDNTKNRTWIPSKVSHDDKTKTRPMLAGSNRNIVYQEINKNNQNAFNALLRRFGESNEEIKKGIEREYQNKRTEKKVKGLFQKVNLKINKVFTTKRTQQINNLAFVIDKLQRDKSLNNHEKGIILQGALKEIIDDIQNNETKNKFKSRLLTLCQEMNTVLDKVGIDSVESETATKMSRAYLEGDAKKFREVAAEVKPRTKKRIDH